MSKKRLKQDGEIRLFVDFDGTVTVKDVGNSIFERFLSPELLEQGWHNEIIELWKVGNISSRECLTYECEYSIVTEKELNTELEKFGLTPGFVETVQYCKRRGIHLMILSDGLDYYIEYILGKYGISDVEYRANHMFFHNGSLAAEFPFVDKGCGRCGNCKRWHMDTIRQDGDVIIYVGDGFSDRYAIRSADIIFAKHDLADYCNKESLNFFPFNNFFDILRYFRQHYGNV